VQQENVGLKLLEAKLIPPDALQKAQQQIKTGGGSITAALVKLGAISEENLNKFLAELYAVASVDLSNFVPDPSVTKLIPGDVANKFQIVPLSRSGRRLTVAMANPSNIFAIDDIKFITGFEVAPVVAPEAAIKKAIDKAYDSVASFENVMKGMEDDIEVIEEEDDQTPDVTLLGEALFEVTKDPSHPFVIQCGELTTTVLGTSFNIKSREKNIEVVVLTGKVSLTSASDKEGIVVLPNEKAVYNGLNKQLVKVETVKKAEKIAAVASTEYRMDFDDTRMGEIIRRIEGKFNVTVTMSDPKLGNCMITADFTDQSLDMTFNMISQALGFEYEINGNQISLRGTGCEEKIMIDNR